MVIFDTRKMADTSDTLNSSACTGGPSSETCWAIPMPYSIPTSVIDFQWQLGKKYTQSLNRQRLHPRPNQPWRLEPRSNRPGVRWPFRVERVLDHVVGALLGVSRKTTQTAGQRRRVAAFRAAFAATGEPR